MQTAKNFIEKLDKKTFFTKYVRGVASSMPFSAVMTFGVGYVSADEREDLRKQVINAGMPSQLVDTDEKLEAALYAIGARSVQVR